MRANADRRVAAVGGARTVPAPDPIARDYLLLALRLEQHVAGLVDAYYGPASLKAQVDLEQRRPPARLREDALALLERLPDEVAEPDRRRWLAGQLVALEAQARSLDVDRLPYVQHVARSLGVAPERVPEADLEAAAEEADRLLPGGGSRDAIAARMAAWDTQFAIPPERLPDTVAWLLSHFRERTRRLFGLPEGEAVRVGFVGGKAWNGYNGYDGGLASRVDLNVDLPLSAPNLLDLLAHEAYPGHHTEQAWREQRLVEGAARLEASMLLVNAPECLISEGLAEVARSFALPVEERPDLLVQLCARAGLGLASDRARLREAADRQVAIGRAVDEAAGAANNAALMLHADGASRAEVLAYLRRRLLVAPERAEKRLSFIEAPLSRTYAFAYRQGERLLRRWLDQVPELDRTARFGRLFLEQLTPADIIAESMPSAVDRRGSERAAADPVGGSG